MLSLCNVHGFVEACYSCNKTECEACQKRGRLAKLNGEWDHPEWTSLIDPVQMTVHVFPKKNLGSSCRDRTRSPFHPPYGGNARRCHWFSSHPSRVQIFKFRLHHLEYRSVIASVGCSFVTYLLPRSDLIRPTRQSRRRTWHRNSSKTLLLSSSLSRERCSVDNL